jgi:hypothetical protein
VPRFNVLQARVALVRVSVAQAVNSYRISQLQLAKTLGWFCQNRGDAPVWKLLVVRFQPRTCRSSGGRVGQGSGDHFKATEANVLSNAEQVRVARWIFPQISTTARSEVRSSFFTDDQAT